MAFIAETEILGINGTRYTISELYHETDLNRTPIKVLCTNNIGHISATEITSVAPIGSSKNLVKIYLDNNQQVICTEDQELMTWSGFTPACIFKRGDKVMSVERDSFCRKVLDVVPLEGTSEVYTISVESEDSNLSLTSGVYAKTV